MKKSFFLSIAALLAFMVGCDNAANMEAMKAQTMRTVDSLAAAEISAQRATLLAQCNQNVEGAIKLRVDSLMAIAAPVKTSLTAPSKPSKPTKPTKPAIKADTPPAKPILPPATPPKKSPLDEQKTRGADNTPANSPEKLQEQKTRGASTTTDNKGLIADPKAAQEQLNKQKTRGASPTPK